MEETVRENGTFDVEFTLLHNNTDNVLSILTVDDVVTVPEYIYVSVYLMETDASKNDVNVQVKPCCLFAQLLSHLILI